MLNLAIHGLLREPARTTRHRRCCDGVRYNEIHLDSSLQGSGSFETQENLRMICCEGLRMREEIPVALFSSQHRQRRFAQNLEGAQKAHHYGGPHGCQQAPSEHHGLNGPGDVQEKVQNDPGERAG